MKSTVDQKIIFFAYQGREKGVSNDIVDAISNAIAQYNQHQKNRVAKSWEEFKKSGPINKEILEIIDNCEVFACDLTYFNPNVLFELGYAIAKDRKILVLLNENIENAKKQYSEFLLKIIRYTPIANSQDVLKALQQQTFKENILKELITVENVEKNVNTLFYIQSKLKNDAAIQLTERIEILKKSNNWSVLSDNTAEVEYKPLTSYLQNILKCRCTVIHFLGNNIAGAFDENAKNSFYAGLACGFDKQVLLLAPSKFRAPLDYYDLLIQYESPGQLCAKVEEILGGMNLNGGSSPVSESKELNLIRLGIGCEDAEGEKDSLFNYFVETASYNAALNLNKSIVVGRKGSGKSALYLKLIDDYSADQRNFVINLRPEPEDLAEDSDMAALFKSAGKKSFFTSVWKLIVFNKLAYAIYERLMAKPSHSQFTKIETDLISFVEKNESFIKLHFLGVVRQLSKSNKDGVKMDDSAVVEQVYDHFLNPLKAILKQYLSESNTKFLKIVILADNLDKTWEASRDLEIQAQMILSLIEIESKIENEIVEKKNYKVEIKKIIFLRKDIFEAILKLKSVSEPDKLVTYSHEINWEEYPDLLKLMLEKRFAHILSLRGEAEAVKVWDEYFEFSDKKSPFEVIKEITTRRPRDVIYLTNRLFEAAVNNRHSKADDKDLDSAIDSYTIFLNNNLIAEMRAEYPDISDVLAMLQKHHGQLLEYKDYKNILLSAGYKKDAVDKLTETLVKKNYLIGFNKEKNSVISDFETFKSKLNERRFYIFPKKFYVIANAKYWYIKNKKYFSF